MLKNSRIAKLKRKHKKCISSIWRGCLAFSGANSFKTITFRKGWNNWSALLFEILRSSWRENSKIALERILFKADFIKRSIYQNFPSVSRKARWRFQPGTVFDSEIRSPWERIWKKKNERRFSKFFANFESGAKLWQNHKQILLGERFVFGRHSNRPKALKRISALEASLYYKVCNGL